MLCLWALLCGGCPQYADPTVPEPIRRVTEPTTRQDYLLYVPSRYQPDRALPLVILAHGTRPWDSPPRQIRDWVKLAEEKNFLVAAPYLKGTRGDFLPAADEQIRRQREDEQTILSVVRHASGANHVDKSRVFLCGWSAGCFAVLHTGLKHPEIFRALALLQGNFDAVYLSDVAGRVNPYQPVQVLYGSIDILTGGQGKSCARWLYDQGAYVFDGEVPGPHRSHPRAAYEFFEQVVREEPWLNIRAFALDPEQPFAVQFKIRASFEPERYSWSFGDGESSPVASPLHTYAEADEYTVTLVATTLKNRRIKRSIKVRVPQVRFRHGLEQ